MSFIITLDNYQGPFDILLELLQSKQLSITELSLSQITEDYIKYIARLELSLEEMNWFLLVATKLTYDKSLAVLAIKAEEDEPDLSETLIGYAKIREMSRTIATLAKQPLYCRDISTPRGPVELCSVQELHHIATTVTPMKQLAPADRAIKSKTKYLEQAREYFKNHIIKLRNFNSSEVLANSKSRADAVIYLLTLLDMLRNGQIIPQHNQLIIIKE